MTEKLFFAMIQKTDHPRNQVAAAGCSLVILNRTQSDIRADAAGQIADRITGQHHLVTDRSDLNKAFILIERNKFSFNLRYHFCFHLRQD